MDAALKQWATPAQARILEAIEQHGSERKAAKALGLSPGTVSGAVAAAKKRAARSGYSPEHDMTHTVPDGFNVKGVSTYFDKDGQPRGQWVKSAIDAERQAEIMREACAAMSESLPRVKPVAGPGEADSALCNLYTFTDYHLGMLASKRETKGDDWDLKIAERTLTAAFGYMVNAAPQAGTAMIAQLGDFLHSDGILPVTPTHGHILDQDGRFSKIVGCAIRVLRRLVDFALVRHDRVVVLMAEGNHDISSSIWLRAMFRALYENEPRVTVIDSELPYYVHQHGETMLGFHHGHLKKLDQLPLLMAAQFPRIWGDTRKRYVHTGHLHHVDEKEHNGITVIQHPTIAARDSHSARAGHVSDRAAKVITYHDRFGEVARNIVVPEMFEAA